MVQEVCFRADRIWKTPRPGSRRGFLVRRASAASPSWPDRGGEVHELRPEEPPPEAPSRGGFTLRVEGLELSRPVAARVHELRPEGVPPEKPPPRRVHVESRGARTCSAPARRVCELPLPPKTTPSLLVVAMRSLSFDPRTVGREFGHRLRNTECRLSSG